MLGCGDGGDERKFSSKLKAEDQQIMCVNGTPSGAESVLAAQ